MNIQSKAFKLKGLQNDSVNNFSHTISTILTTMSAIRFVKNDIS